MKHLKPARQKRRKIESLSIQVKKGRLNEEIKVKHPETESL